MRRQSDYPESVLRTAAVLLSLSLWAAAEPRSLFSAKDLQGWEQQGPHPSFYTAQRELRTSGKGHAGNWIFTDSDHQDFRLRFEYKLAQWAEAAVILRAPRSDRPQHAGLTITLAHDFHKVSTPWITGGIMGVLPPRKVLPPSFEEWHTVETELRGALCKVTIDDVILQELDTAKTPALAHRLRTGRIGFPDMGYAYSLRNINVEDFPIPGTRILDLAPVDSLESWGKRGDSGEWRIENGVIEGMNGHSILYPPAVLDDFEFTAVVRTHHRVNAGIFLRGQPVGPNRGFEVQICSPVDAVYQTGSLYARQRSSLQADLEGHWFLLQIHVEGKHCTVWVDGQQTAAVDNLPPDLLKPGRIGLQVHSDDGRVEFRDLRARPL